MAPSRRKRERIAAEKNAQIQAQRAAIETRIEEQEAYIDTAYLKIGEKFYAEMHDRAIPDGYMELFEEIAQHMTEIETCEKQIQDMSNILVCPVCGCECEKGSLFCYNCGNKLTSEKESKSEEVRCPRCGGDLPPDAVFCPNCGNKVK